MTDNYSFRSSVNGFNRHDVMDFIEKVFADGEKQKEKIAELEAQLQEKNEEIEKFKKELAENSAKCENCDIAKVYEARLGAAMLDAKRFSEVLVKEANDTAFNMFSSACVTATNTSQKAEDISGEIRNIAESFNESFSKLFEQMSSLSIGLKDFIREIDANSKQFVYTTDFSGITAEKNAVKEKLNAEYDETEKREEKSVTEEKSATSDKSAATHGFNLDFSFLNSDGSVNKG